MSKRKKYLCIFYTILDFSYTTGVSDGYEQNDFGDGIRDADNIDTLAMVDDDDDDDPQYCDVEPQNAYTSVDSSQECSQEVSQVSTDVSGICLNAEI